MHESSATTRAAQMVREARRIVLFTGAGISAESGIPTYRDALDSVWQKYDPDKVVHIDYFLKDARPFWHFFRDYRYRVMATARPNPGHRAIAAMQRTGKVLALITQNIDGLHQQAGSTDVIELHGNTRWIKCLDCGHRCTMEEAYRLLEQGLPPPCPVCRGRLKPDVVFFGEALPQDELTTAGRAVLSCDLLIAVGSSLQVYPAAALPEQAKRKGARLIIVNKTPTPFDHFSDAVVREPAGEALPILAVAAGAEMG